MSYLNLDWTPVPINSKFVDIVVNVIAERTYDIRAYSQDPHGLKERTEHAKALMSDIKMRDFNTFAAQFGMDLTESNVDELPDTIEEADLYMQLTYKQAIEIAEEQALNVLLEGNS